MQKGLHINGDNTGCLRAMEFTMMLQGENSGVVARVQSGLVEL